MKVPPKRKGNISAALPFAVLLSLNESPSEKEGKCRPRLATKLGRGCLNESPSEKEGKFKLAEAFGGEGYASMKVPPKRKGNLDGQLIELVGLRLNESPSEKEGKCCGNDSDSRFLGDGLNESPSEKEGKSA